MVKVPFLNLKTYIVCKFGGWGGGEPQKSVSYSLFSKMSLNTIGSYYKTPRFFHSDPDLNPDPTFHFDTNPDPDPDLNSVPRSEMWENLNYLNFYFQQCQSTHYTIFSSASYASFFSIFWTVH